MPSQPQRGLANQTIELSNRKLLMFQGFELQTFSIRHQNTIKEAIDNSKFVGVHHLVVMIAPTTTKRATSYSRFNPHNRVVNYNIQVFSGLFDSVWAPNTKGLETSPQHTM